MWFIFHDNQLGILGKNDASYPYRNAMLDLTRPFLFVFVNMPVSWMHGIQVSSKNRFLFSAGCACAGNAGNIFRPLRVSDPGMHHGTCAMHVSWCMPGSLTSGFLWSRWRGKRYRHSRRMRNPQFYVSGTRPMVAKDPSLAQLSIHWAKSCLTVYMMKMNRL